MARANPYFNWTRIGKNLLLIISLIVVNKFGTLGNVLCYLVLFAMALKNTEGALKALSISGLLIVASEFFVIHGAPFGPLKFLLLLVAGLTILRAARNPLGQPFLVFLILFGFVAAGLAVINDYFVEVSLLKIGSFTYGAFCLLAVVRVRRNIASEMTEWTVSLILAAVLLSYLVLVTGSNYGSLEAISGSRFSGHRGMFSHPADLGGDS